MSDTERGAKGWNLQSFRCVIVEKIFFSRFVGFWMLVFGDCRNWDDSRATMPFVSETWATRQSRFFWIRFVCHWDRIHCLIENFTFEVYLDDRFNGHWRNFSRGAQILNEAGALNVALNEAPKKHWMRHWRNIKSGTEWDTEWNTEWNTE